MIELRCRFKRYVIFTLFFVLVLSFTACNQSKKGEDSKEVTYEKSLSFDDFLEKMLKEDLSSDLTSYVQFVENPSNFGLTTYSKSLQGGGIEDFNKQTIQAQSRLKHLEAYDYDKLSQEQKLDYDTIKTYLDLRLSIKDLAYYQDSLSTLQGDHIIIPGILGLHAARFFDTLEARGIQEISAVEKYFEVYPALGDYLMDLAQFEREKAEKGLFMDQDRANEVARVSLSHVKNEGSEIQKAFMDELEELSWLSDEDRDALLEKNSKLVKEHIVVGYQALVDAMKENADKGGKLSYLGETEEGKRYYEAVLKASINDSSSVEEMEAKLNQYMNTWLAERSQILELNPGIMNDINTKLRSYADADLLVNTLTEKSKDIFPDVRMDWGIGKMPESMNGFAMGLFYPQAMDSSIQKQIVYVGTLLNPGAANYVQTIGHEGVPGHLYNYSYFLNLDISQYRKFIAWVNSTGSLEGWTTYIEEYCYRFVGLSDTEARYLQLNRLIELGLIQVIDFGVNYHGWKTADVSNYLKEVEPAYLLMSAYIENMVKDSICTGGPYVMGYIYLTEIKEEMKEKMGTKFTDLEFHTRYLNVGPTTFDLLREQLLEE